MRKYFRQTTETNSLFIYIKQRCTYINLNKNKRVIRYTPCKYQRDMTLSLSETQLITFLDQFRFLSLAGMSNLLSNGVRLAPNETDLGNFKISFSTYLRLILKSPRFVSFEANLTQFGWHIWHPWHLHDFKLRYQIRTEMPYRHQMGQIWDFWTQAFTTFMVSVFKSNRQYILVRQARQNVLETVI